MTCNCLECLEIRARVRLIEARDEARDRLFPPLISPETKRMWAENAYVAYKPMTFERFVKAVEDLSKQSGFE